jgi:hypothetical protein
LFVQVSVEQGDPSDELQLREELRDGELDLGGEAVWYGGIERSRLKGIVSLGGGLGNLSREII